MNSLSKTWVPPVTLSVFLHGIVIAVAWHQLKQITHFPVEQLITVEMLNNAEPAPVKSVTFKQQAVTPPVMPQPTVVETPSNLAEKPAAAVAETSATPTAQSQTNNSQPVFQPISKLTKPPSFLTKIEPVYPVAEQRSGSQAYVLAEITLDAAGKVLNIAIMKSAGSYFDNAVIEAIRLSSFSPGYIEQEPVAVKVLLPFRFKLR